MFFTDKAKSRLEERNTKKYLVLLWDYLVINENQSIGIIKIFLNHA